MEARDIYIKRTPENGKPPVITEHRVWDAELFVKSQQEQARVGAEKDPDHAETVAVATEQDYRAQGKA